MSAQTGQGQRTCQLCGNLVPPNAQYCPSCGARQTPVDSVAAQSFEDAIADVLDDEEHAAPGAASEGDWTPPGQQADPSTFNPVSATPPPPPPQQGWATTPHEQPTGWGNLPPSADSSGPGRNRTLWIVLSIFGFITFCCCGVTFLSVAVA